MSDAIRGRRRMKAILEIELEVDGEWRPGDTDRLLDLILEHPENGGWTVEEDRLVVLANEKTIEIKEVREGE